LQDKTAGDFSTMHIKDISGIILCGGKSKRYGSDKGLAFYHGKQLIQHAIEKLIPLCDEILISSNNNNYHHFGYPCIADDIKQAGPASGILSAMKKAKHENCLVLACDMPDVPSELFSFLLEEKRIPTLLSLFMMALLNRLLPCILKA
jgi:molybdopterin-guanine dinucleotide biosynthesis protein A